VTHWSSRLLAAELGISNVKVAGVWREWGLQPWRTESFKFSADPQLEARVRDVIGLYLNPPDKAVVLCADEKPRTQALERKAPVLPLRPGVPEKRSHDYIRHGTTALFAALEAATGKVTGACYPQHRHQEFLAFLRQVARAYPRRKLHIACDSYGTHNHPDVPVLGRHPPVEREPQTPVTPLLRPAAGTLHPGRQHIGAGTRTRVATCTQCHRCSRSPLQPRDGNRCSHASQLPRAPQRKHPSAVNTRAANPSEQNGQPGRQIVGRGAAACHTSRVSVTILEREMYTEAAAARLLRIAPSTLH
jgi:hypothetical protein